MKRSVAHVQQHTQTLLSPSKLLQYEKVKPIKKDPPDKEHLFTKDTWFSNTHFSALPKKGHLRIRNTLDLDVSKVSFIQFHYEHGMYSPQSRRGLVQDHPSLPPVRQHSDE